MTNSGQHPNGPTKRQIKLLGDLAIETGRTFVFPRTAAQAGTQIEDLLRVKRTARADRRRESRQVGEDLATRFGDAAAVRDDEIVGYGSTAGWAGRRV